jgi:antitoxin CptB
MEPGGAAGRCLERSIMSGPMLSSCALDERRRRLLFRARRRGVREMDLVMGGFADLHLPVMSEPELAEFEALLDVPDPQILAWITGEEPTPSEFDTPLIARLRAAPREAEERFGGAA